ncbi:thioredoxin [Flammeovirga yaeyamensis]|uniref:Thioredoxin n=1 Tax=Flammeovirga yaeyamensis TaxID=367791 RepID=A0AAX1N308_9BACT|nr:MULTISPECIES: thioredoxin [Flammeovirga]ANQ50757.1 thioredoxin [Flammeovirga sp. MY04]MBB3701530.1 thioredoxin 1 [Flammeovirga yaeyamensis]NMF38656.1 thioredoxin [Flammeovirga yaeyamensis]QWG01849.1 thioredoxin [Flammeovirga yaeyamensis]
MSKFSNLIQNSEVPVLVDFYADWCQPCHMIAPTIRSIKTKMGDKLKVIKVNSDNNQKAMMKYQVRSIPTLILFHKGKILWRNSGVLPEFELEKILSKHIN